ncbi:transcriptional regulator [Leptospira interrogans serovar Geyaweera]|nr:transcriptional regulator [Leptospira interrogans serovar Geyaweera]
MGRALLSKKRSSAFRKSKKPGFSRAFFVPECDLRKIFHSKKMDLEQESIHEGNATRALS